ncbi:MAG: hypothetical protein WAW80_03585 [Candidatus Saccharimonadales bacterium]
MFKSNLIQRSLISFALVTVLGILVHDTKLDQATTIALAIPFSISISLMHAPELRSEGHTHVERVSVDRTIHMIDGLPKIQPRTDNRKYLLAKHINTFNMPDEHTLIVQPTLA